MPRRCPILSLGGEVLGSMCVIDDKPRQWQREELDSLATLTRAVANELRLRQSLEVAQQSQTASAELACSLLPPVLVPVPGLQAAVSYLPAAGDTVVGDFYEQATGKVDEYSDQVKRRGIGQVEASGCRQPE